VDVAFTIRFFSEDVPFVLKDKTAIRSWLKEVILEEGKSLHGINYIFCSDDYLLTLNKTYLQHDTLTDIITFPYEETAGQVSGDIFISVERVKENSEEFRQDFKKEIKRVMVHGLLHLIGYGDHDKKEKKVMRTKEDYYLNKS
jgi:probable rRNA maturation factor